MSLAKRLNEKYGKDEKKMTQKEADALAFLRSFQPAIYSPHVKTKLKPKTK